MLVSFTLENWKSFKNPVTLSMRASKERFATSTLTKLSSRYGTKKILPTAAIFGPNAAGKTSLLEGLVALRRLVVKGVRVNRTIPIQPFASDSKTPEKPTCFTVEMLIEDLIYRYEARVTKKEVVFESLYVERTNNSHLMFLRNGENIEFGRGFDTERNQLSASNTRTNQLFLHSAVVQNVEFLQSIYDWFDKALVEVTLDSYFTGHSQLMRQKEYVDFINNRLMKYNTGIEEVILDSVNIESVPISEDTLSDYINIVPKDMDFSFQWRPEDKPDIYIITIKNEDVEASKIKTMHVGPDGEHYIYELEDESKGTQRLFELLPLFFNLSHAFKKETDSPLVYFVDELNNSFHSHLTRDLIESFLEECNSDNKRQLIFTTHDLLLMDENLLRRDEIWLCDKVDGVSTLACVGNHPGIRGDLSLLKNYNAGKFGGVPLLREKQLSKHLTKRDITGKQL